MRPRFGTFLVTVGLAVGAVGVTVFLQQGRPHSIVQPAHGEQTPHGSAPLRVDPWRGGVVTMVSTSTGWAHMDKSILRTTDGGSHWRVVNSAAVLLDQYGSAGAYFFDDTHAWFMSRGAQETQITRTSDGGRTWQKGTAFSPAVNLVGQNNVVESALYFVDPQHGWLLLRSKVGWICPPKSFPLPTPTGPSLCSGPLAGPYSAAIYGTSDGGDHWSLLVESLGSGSANQVLGLDCREVGLRFDKTGTGWLGFTCVQDQRVGPIIGITHDGGRNWQALKLPYAPTGDGPWAQMTWPIFLADGKGLVQLDYPGILFATADGGRTWTPHPLPCTAIPPTNACASGGPADFIDPANGWLSALDGLYRTTNGGGTWTLIAPRAGEPIQTQFLDANNGFGLKDVSAPCTGCGDTVDGVPSYTFYQIQKTTDRGHSWKVVQPMVQGPPYLTP